MAARLADERDFDSTWHELLFQYEPAVRVTSALLKLTGAGEHPVQIEQLAEAIDRPLHETLDLLRQWTTARVENGQATLTLVAGRSDSRYRLQIGARTVDAQGCAPDIFWMALASDKAIRARTVCPATNTPIVIDITPQRVDHVEPKTVVVAVMNPRTPELQSITSSEQANLVVCPQQPVFASTSAAAIWLVEHPNGRLFPVSGFLDWWREHLRRLHIL